MAGSSNLPVTSPGNEAIVSAFSNILIEVATHKGVFNVIDEVTYSTANLSKSMEEQPGRLAWWNSVHAALSDLHRRAVRTLKESQALARRNARMSIQARGGKSTEQMIEDEATLDPSLKAIELACFDLELKVDQVSGILHALRDRKDMMVEEGKRQLAEYRSETSVRKD